MINEITDIIDAFRRCAQDLWEVKHLTLLSKLLLTPVLVFGVMFLFVVVGIPCIFWLIVKPLFVKTAATPKPTKESEVNDEQG